VVRCRAPLIGRRPSFPILSLKIDDVPWKRCLNRIRLMKLPDCQQRAIKFLLPATSRHRCLYSGKSHRYANIAALIS
jgi:hypothetical protein